MISPRRSPRRLIRDGGQRDDERLDQGLGGVVRIGFRPRRDERVDVLGVRGEVLLLDVDVVLGGVDGRQHRVVGGVLAGGAGERAP